MRNQQSFKKISEKMPDTPYSKASCDLCSDIAVVMIYAPNGCTCLANKYQRRCMQHLIRADDYKEEFEIVEDYRVYKNDT